MDEPGDYHTKWSKTEKDKLHMQQQQHGTYVESKKKYIWMNLLREQKQTHTDLRVGAHGSREEGRGKR